MKSLLSLVAAALIASIGLSGCVVVPQRHAYYDHHKHHTHYYSPPLRTHYREHWRH